MFSQSIAAKNARVTGAHFAICVTTASSDLAPTVPKLEVVGSDAIFGAGVGFTVHLDYFHHL